MNNHTSPFARLSTRNFIAEPCAPPRPQGDAAAWPAGRFRGNLWRRSDTIPRARAGGFAGRYSRRRSMKRLGVLVSFQCRRGDRLVRSRGNARTGELRGHRGGAGRSPGRRKRARECALCYERRRGDQEAVTMRLGCTPLLPFRARFSWVGCSEDRRQLHRRESSPRSRLRRRPAKHESVPAWRAGIDRGSGAAPV